MPAEMIRRIFRVDGPLPNIAPSWNVAPRQQAPVVRRHPETGARHLHLLEWGLVPRWTKDLKAARRPINARAETVARTPMFRDAFARRRCLVPADAFYEWQKSESGKLPYAIARADGAPLALAGLWEGWRAPDDTVLRSFAIVVTAANATMAPIHDRMPVILEQADWPLWLGEVEGDPTTLLHPAPDDALRLWRVASDVNRPSNNSEALLNPI